MTLGALYAIHIVDSLIADGVTRFVPLRLLTPSAWNPRTITERAFLQLVASIMADPEYLLRRAIEADAQGVIYGGNQRFRAIQHLDEVGWITRPTWWPIGHVPVGVSDVDSRLAKERGLRDNKGFGEWQDEQLSEILHELQDLGTDLETFGFDEIAMTQLLELAGSGSGVGPDESSPDEDDLRAAEVLEDPDLAAELLAKWGVKPGDLWTAKSLRCPGKSHRLLCGDGLDDAQVKAVLGGERADFAFADPPYNVGKDYGETVDDEQAAEQYRGFCVRLSLRLLECTGGPVAVTPGVRNLGLWYEIADPGQVWPIAWVKMNGAARNGFGGGPNKWDPVLIYRPPADSGTDVIQANNVYTKTAEAGGGHPGPKPIALMENLIERFCPQRGMVFDPVSGSGTTVVACERTGRVGAVVELEPKWLALQLERLALLGLQPERFER